jgi:hypothetical protein
MVVKYQLMRTPRRATPIHVETLRVAEKSQQCFECLSMNGKHQGSTSVRPEPRRRTPKTFSAIY